MAKHTCKPRSSLCFSRTKSASAKHGHNLAFKINKHLLTSHGTGLPIGI